MTKMYKSFCTKTVPELNWNSGVTSFCSWERLYPQIATAVGLKPNEKIVGIEINECGILTKIEYK